MLYEVITDPLSGGDRTDGSAQAAGCGRLLLFGCGQAIQHSLAGDMGEEYGRVKYLYLIRHARITSYNVCYTKLLRHAREAEIIAQAGQRGKVTIARLPAAKA